MRHIWITDELRDEIYSCYPSEGDKQVDQINKNITMCKTAFERKCQRLFPTGRVFLNSVQLVQVSNMFLSSWYVKKVHNQCKIRCAYSHNGRKRKEITNRGVKKRHVAASMKNQIKCPFEIRYSPMRIKGKICTISKVKITKCVSKHSCQMSTAAYRTAIGVAKGHPKIDLENLTAALSILKIHPRLEAQQLRPLLVNAVPKMTLISSKFMDNFRKRAALYHAQNPHTTNISLSLEDGLNLSRQTDVTEKDHAILDDPIIRLNFLNMYRNMLHNDANT